MVNRLRTHWLRLIVHIGAWLPLIWILWDALNHRLGAEPIREIILRTGKTALVLLILSLACTPANSWLGFREALRVRRALGLYAFMYATVHLLIFVGVDYAFDWSLLYAAIFERPYALVGFAAFLVLLPIAMTSTQGWMKRLGQTWTRLHRGVYVVALLVIVHFVWSVKLDVREPLTYGAIVVALLILRLPPLRRKTSRRPSIPSILRRHHSNDAI